MGLTRTHEWPPARNVDKRPIPRYHPIRRNLFKSQALDAGTSRPFSRVTHPGSGSSTSVVASISGDGYINIDLQAFHEPDVIGNALDLTAFPSNWADELVVSDVLEHIKRTETCSALLEWGRVLRLGGTVHIRTTYLPGLLRRMNYDWFGSLETHKMLILNLFSSQKYEGDFHFTAFTEKLMKFYLWACGFSITKLDVADNWLFVVAAEKVIDYSYEDLCTSTMSDKAFVLELYRRILKRLPDPPGMAGKIEMLDGSPASRRAVISSFLGSEEREQLMMSEAPQFELEYDPA